MKVIVTALFFSLIQLVLMAGARANHPYYQTKETKVEDEVLSKINELPEVRNFIRKNKAEKAALIIAREPDPAFKYYWVKPGISNIDMFRTSDDFYIYPKTLKIYFLDLSDTSGSAIIPLQRWRKLRSDPLFFKPHTFKAGKMIPVKLSNKHENKSSNPKQKEKRD